MKSATTFNDVSMDDAKQQMNSAVKHALLLAERNGIDVTLYELSLQWICAVEGEVVHVNDLPKLVDAAIAKLQRKEAA